MKSGHHLLTSALILIVLLAGCSRENTTPDDKLSVATGNLTVAVNDRLYTALSIDGKQITAYEPGEYLRLADGDLRDFSLISSAVHETVRDSLGQGSRLEVVGKASGVEKHISFTTYDTLPGFVVTEVYYLNTSDSDLIVDQWINQSYAIPKSSANPAFWSFQGSSNADRDDWIRPVSEGYYNRNYMGMNASDYGGGIPVTDIWTPDFGLAIGHLAMTPELVSLPVEWRKGSDKLRISIEKSLAYPTYFSPRDTLRTLPTFVAVHQGDYYNGLQKFSRYMQASGIHTMPVEPSAFEPIWCAWGYERNFTLDEILGTLPKVKEMGIRWVVLDDGYQQAEGDWEVNSRKFPGGDSQMRNFVRKIHDEGMKAKIWWAPLAVDPGSKLLRDEPGVLLQTSDWAPRYITWWDSYYMSPVNTKTLEHTRDVVRLFMQDWGFDGLKLDGQHMNAVPPDYNEASGLKNPEDAVRGLPDFFREIYKTARGIKPHAVVENCPCGTCMSYYNMAWMNQAVASDPLNSWQVRLKGKTYKALIPETAYYGDHVELSDGADDFASSFGVGAVLGTKFTWPEDNPTAEGSYRLTPEKEKIWKHWFSLYNRKMLSRETYRGDLYDIGYDKPETHVIQKGDTLHYAFYADTWDGEIPFRGLGKGEYRIHDYVNDQDLGRVEGPEGTLSLQFENNLLVEAIPVTR